MPEKTRLQHRKTVSKPIFNLPVVNKQLKKFRMILALCSLFTLLVFNQGCFETSQLSQVSVANTSNRHSKTTSPKTEIANQEPQISTERLDEINQLLTQLDASTFEERESAAKSLASIGEPAVTPLAFKSFECSPESGWRIKKVLEEICVNGSEIVFFKTSGVLQLRFQNHNAEMERRLDELQAKWREQRKKVSIKKLRERGAVITDPWEDLPPGIQQPQPNVQFFGQPGANFVIVNGQVVEIMANETPVKSIKKNKIKLSEAEQKRQIVKIMASDLKQAREMVFGEKKPKQKDSSNQNAINMQRHLVLNQGFGNMGGAGTTQGVVAEFDKRWKGTATDLSLLQDLTNLNTLKFTEQTIDQNSIKIASDIPTLAMLTFKNCKIDAQAISKSKWSPSLKDLEFSEQKLTTELIKSFATIKSLQMLTFQKCDVSKAEFSSLNQLPGVRGIQVKDSDLTKDLFEALSDLDQLTYVNLSACKFKTNDYKSLKRKRPNLQITFTAQAFLGVRGPIDLIPGTHPDASDGCVISEVITGSGADKAGMEVDDVILKVNGEPCVTFDDLRLHIAQHRPGESLDVIVRRNKKQVKLKITLTAFDASQE